MRHQNLLPFRVLIPKPSLRASGVFLMTHSFSPPALKWICLAPAAWNSAPNIVLGPEHQEHPNPFPCCFEPRPPSPLVTSLRDAACIRASACPQGTLQLRVCSGRGWERRRSPVRSSHPNVSLLAGLLKARFFKQNKANFVIFFSYCVR